MFSFCKNKEVFFWMSGFMWIFLSLPNPLELSFPVIYWCCLPAQACLWQYTVDPWWSLTQPCIWNWLFCKKRQKKTLTNPHPMYGMTQFLWIGEVLQIRDEFFARLLRGKVDYMKNGMANKLNGVKPGWAEAVLKLWLLCPPPCLQRGQKLKNSLCESVVPSGGKMSVMLWLSPQHHSPWHSTSWVVVSYTRMPFWLRGYELIYIFLNKTPPPILHLTAVLILM